MTDSLSTNPFRPGAGRLPAYMGHREAVERPLLEIVHRLRTGQKDPYLAYLYGPRGTGKTVLLRWLADDVAQEIGEPPIAHVRLLPGHLASSDAVVQRIRSAIRQTPGILDNLTVDLEAGIPGVSLKLGSEPPGDPMLGLSDWLDQDLYPVLFSLDEAHEADPVVLGRFLNAVQLGGQQRLEPRHSLDGALAWNRAEKALGKLDRLLRLALLEGERRTAKGACGIPSIRSRSAPASSRRPCRRRSSASRRIGP